MSKPRAKKGQESDRRIGSLLRLAWQHVRARIDEGVLAGGYEDLSRAHLAMFRYEGLEGRRPTHLAEQMHITKQSINDLLRHLEARGYLELTPDPRDSRARLISLTPRGRELERVVRSGALAAERELARFLGSRRFNQLRDTLLEIARFNRAVAETEQPAVVSRNKRAVSAN